MSGFLSTNAFWTICLFVHLIVALGLLGAITHQAIAVALPVRKPAAGFISRYRAVPAAGYATAVCVLYVLNFLVGSFIYTQYRIGIRPELEIGHYYKTKIAGEHVYWDQGSVLAQLGILDPAKVPVKGAGTARTLLDWAGIETPA